MADIEKILIVDDDKLNLKLLYQRLKNDSREIIEAMSGKEALDMLREHPDVYLVVLDVNMPGMDGFETAEIILSQESTKHLPILFVTASQLSDISAEKGYRVGAVDYITKPINPAILQGKVEAFLRLTRQQKQLQEINLTLEKEKAEAASTAKSVFLRNMSHSLLTPMNGILGVLELLRQEMDEESVPSQVEMIGMVKNSAGKIT